MAFMASSGPEKSGHVYEFEEYNHTDVEFTEAEEKKLVRKIDLFLLPTIWLMYLLSYMDRTKYSPTFQFAANQ